MPNQAYIGMLLSGPERLMGLSPEKIKEFLTTVRDACDIERAIRLAAMVEATPPENPDEHDRFLKQFTEAMNATWRDYAPGMFKVLEKAAAERGVKLDEDPKQEVLRSIALDKRIIGMLVQGKIAIAQKVDRPLRGTRDVLTS